MIFAVEEPGRPGWLANSRLVVLQDEYARLVKETKQLGLRVPVRQEGDEDFIDEAELASMAEGHAKTQLANRRQELCKELIPLYKEMVEIPNANRMNPTEIDTAIETMIKNNIAVTTGPAQFTNSDLTTEFVSNMEAHLTLMKEQRLELVTKRNAIIEEARAIRYELTGNVARVQFKILKEGERGWLAPLEIAGLTEDVQALRKERLDKQDRVAAHAAIKIQLLVRRNVARQALAARRVCKQRREELLEKLVPLYEETFTLPSKAVGDSRRKLIEKVILRDVCGQDEEDGKNADTLTKAKIWALETRLELMMATKEKLERRVYPMLQEIKQLRGEFATGTLPEVKYKAENTQGWLSAPNLAEIEKEMWTMRESYQGLMEQQGNLKLFEAAVKLQTRIRMKTARVIRETRSRLKRRRAELFDAMYPLYEELFNLPASAKGRQRRALVEKLILRDVVGKGGDSLSDAGAAAMEAKLVQIQIARSQLATKLKSIHEEVESLRTAMDGRHLSSILNLNRIKGEGVDGWLSKDNITTAQAELKRLQHLENPDQAHTNAMNTMIKQATSVYNRIAALNGPMSEDSTGAEGGAAPVEDSADLMIKEELMRAHGGD